MQKFWMPMNAAEVIYLPSLKSWKYVWKINIFSSVREKKYLSGNEILEKVSRAENCRIDSFIHVAIAMNAYDESFMISRFS